MIGLIFRRVRSISVDALGGIASQAPKFAFFFSFFALSIAGLPGTGGFVAELLIIIGAFKYGVLTGVVTAVTMVAAITFVFWMLQRTLYGASNTTTAGFKDLSARITSYNVCYTKLLRIVSGHMTEFSAMKFALYFMGEYIAMNTASAVVITMFLGGYQLPWLSTADLIETFGSLSIAFMVIVPVILYCLIRWMNKNNDVSYNFV